MKLGDVGKALGNAVTRVEETVAKAVDAVRGQPAPSQPAVGESGFEAPKDLSRLGGQPPPPAAGSGPAVRAGSPGLERNLQGLGLQPESGGQIPFANGAQAERATRSNAARTQVWTAEQIRQNPNGFLANVVQIDGIDGTTADRSSCGPTALMMGMIAGRPDSARELASHLIDAQGHPTADCLRLMPAADANSAEMRAALTRMRSGNFSARDVTFVAEGFRDHMAGGGVSSQSLISLRNSIAGMGVSVPRMELQNFGHPDGTQGHWRVNVNGTQYNPWPDEHGHSGRMGTVGSLTSGSHDGAGWQCREKLWVDDTSATLNTYSFHAGAPGSAQHWQVTDDPPLLSSRYERQADGSMRRTSVNPQRAAQVTNGQMSPSDVDAVVPPSIQ